jgi:UPF0755 protein
MKKIFFWGVLGMLLLVLAGGIGGYFLFLYPNTKPVNAKIVIPNAVSEKDFFQILQEKKILKNLKTFKLAKKILQFDKIKQGKYNIAANSNNLTLIRLLKRGQHYPVTFTFNNVRTVEQLIAKTDQKFLFDTSELSHLLNDSIFLASYQLSFETLPAIFIPNTYELWYDISAQDFFEKMYKEYKKFWTKERKAKAAQIPLSLLEVSVLASIVEEENHIASEKPIIAGLYINRLRKGMPLQADPTLKFIWHDFSLYRLYDYHKEIDSPYNTYKYAGLPPGPIRIPDEISIDAVLNYQENNYLYMCAKEDFSGYHYFTASYSQHLQNAEKYRKALNRKAIK